MEEDKFTDPETEIVVASKPPDLLAALKGMLTFFFDTKATDFLQLTAKKAVFLEMPSGTELSARPNVVMKSISCPAGGSAPCGVTDAAAHSHSVKPMRIREKCYPGSARMRSAISADAHAAEARPSARASSNMRSNRFATWE